MIDVSFYIKKLDVLKEYMADVVDDRRGSIYIDTSVFLRSDYSIADFFRIFESTGVMLLFNDSPTLTLRKLTFEEYFQFKTNEHIKSNLQ